MTDCCPIASGDGHDLPGVVDEGVPSVAAVVDDIVEGFENSVRQPVLPHELPDVFLAVEFGCAWRELQERDVVWNLEGLGAMPPGLIEEENSVSARSDFGCDLIGVKLHRFGVAGRQHEGGAGSAWYRSLTHLAREGRMTFTIGRRELLAALGGCIAARGARAAGGDAGDRVPQFGDARGA